jgi:predicted  nucleic acid-binding Zn-ribbon protein
MVGIENARTRPKSVTLEAISRKLKRINQKQKLIRADIQKIERSLKDLTNQALRGIKMSPSEYNALRSKLGMERLEKQNKLTELRKDKQKLLEQRSTLKESMRT